MIWNSVADFASMGGYALYVWGSFGVSALALLLEPLFIRKRHTDIVRTLRRQLAAEKTGNGSQVKRWKKRAAIIGGGLVAIGIAAALVLNALNSNIALYVTPSEVFAGKAPKSQAFRIGGLVKDGSLRRDNLTVHFIITDLAQDIPVAYTGILPDLFKEGKGAVVQVKANAGGEYIATEVLAKHDENYMPPEAKDALDKAQKTKGTATP